MQQEDTTTPGDLIMEHVIHGRGQAALNVCGCGRLHFTYGPITLHMDRDEFVAFADTVTRLASQLGQPNESPGVTPSPNYSDTLCH
jgi:hypothetical protein